MASIPCASRHSLSLMQDLQTLFQPAAEPSPNSNSTPIAALQYFNMRVTQRLHRYRSLKRQWQEVATSVQNLSSQPSPCSVPLTFPEILSIVQETTQQTQMRLQRKKPVESKSFSISEFLDATKVNDEQEKKTIDLDPLRSRIQQDLIKLRRFIKTKQGTAIETLSVKNSLERKSVEELILNGTTLEEQEHHNSPPVIRRESLLKKLKPLDHVKIAGSQMRRPTPRPSESIDSGIVSASNSSSTCSTYPKPPVKVSRPAESKTFDITHSRVNLPPPPPPPPPAPALLPPPPPPKKKPVASTKSLQVVVPKPTLPPRPPILPRASSFTKQETPLPSIHMPLKIDESSTSDYTFAAPSSSAIPPCMMLKRKSSLLPIFVQSSCCTGLRNDKHLLQMSEEFDLAMGTAKIGEEKTHPDDYYHLLDFKQLVNRLPTPVVSIRPPQGQDDYGILFEQLDHIRETMPNVTVYDDYARVV